MSSMPGRDAPGQPGGSTERSARPGEWGTPNQGSAPESEQFGGAQADRIPGQEAGERGGQRGGRDPEPATTGPATTGPATTGPATTGPAMTQPAMTQPAVAPVTEAETRVTWRRIFQYWIDAFFVSVIPYLVSIPFDRSSSVIMNVIGGVLYVVLFVLIGLWYWVIRPHSHSGQTFAMKWFGLRVISKDGGPASLLQLFVRWISLLFDSAPWMWPFTGLLGLIVMLCSRYRQRIGDHFAKTLVIRTPSNRYGDAGIPSQYGQSGTLREGTMQVSPGAEQQTSADQGDAGQRAPIGMDQQGRSDQRLDGRRLGLSRRQLVTPDAVLAGLADSAALRRQQVQVVHGLADGEHLVHQVEFAELALA
jgi:uncharacterized RDD family membrane protein YckC